MYKTYMHKPERVVKCATHLKIHIPSEDSSSRSSFWVLFLFCGLLRGKPVPAEVLGCGAVNIYNELVRDMYSAITSRPTGQCIDKSGLLN